MLSSNQESSYRIRRLMEINKVSDHKNTQHQPQPKKQIRKRLHTSTKPYQERLLNMAEARREIVTALKFHRASMKQQQTTANNNRQPPPEPEKKSISGMYPALVPPPPPPPMNQENLNLVLPDQTLGLNLNFKDFINLNTSIYYNPLPASTGPSAAKEVAVVKSEVRCKNLETNEIGTHENGKKVVVDSHEDDIGCCLNPFEEVMEFPTWLVNANEMTSCFHDIIFDHHSFFHEYSQDPALPCMDIGEIEGIDGEEWLAGEEF